MLRNGLDRLLDDRSRALRPTAVLQGIDVGVQLQQLREIAELVMVVRGYLTSMEMDGTDERSACGVLLVRMRASLDLLEQSFERDLYGKDGVIL